jgi:hypothetical protein
MKCGRQAKDLFGSEWLRLGVRCRKLGAQFVHLVLGLNLRDPAPVQFTPVVKISPSSSLHLHRLSRRCGGRVLILALALLGAPAWATPSNKAALEKHYDKFLGAGLNRCTTCHLPSPLKDPESLRDFPHNAFGDALRELGDGAAIDARLAALAHEDSDGDGIDNETELLAGGNPGDAQGKPTAEQLADAAKRSAEVAKFLATYRWRPFERVQRPPIPTARNVDWVRTPIDAFIAAEHAERGLKPRPGAAKAILLRRVYLDLIGLAPTPEEQRAFENDHSSDAYEKVVDRLLADPRHGERWGRHWMDIWRYSDWAGWTDGKQIRDSQRHIWRWRDWIVESLNSDRGYDRMLIEMLAADEIAPDDPATLRATGFLVRNYKMLSREQWLEDTVKHTAQAFLGVTLGCAKCHDHRTDPISQAEYYAVRAIFEPHQVRTDRVPGELDREKDGVPRVFDAAKEAPTYFLVRGDERTPDKKRPIAPAVPRALSGGRPELAIAPVALTRAASSPDRREFVIKDSIAASEQSVAKAAAALKDAKPEQLKEREFDAAIADAKHAALLAVLRAEHLEDKGKKDSDEWKDAAKDASTKQGKLTVCEAQLAVHKATAPQADAQRRVDEATAAIASVATAAASSTGAAPAAEPDKAKQAALDKARKDLEAATKKSTEAAQALAKAEESAKAEPTTGYKPRPCDDYPAVSTGRRLAFAKWLANENNPLAARVAMNHLWLRHFGRGLVATPENLGVSGARPSHPALLDWLAAEFMASGWKMKAMHRMIVTSSTYRMASTPDAEDAQADPDDIYLWRMPARRMEAELVRDNLLYAAGNLDLAMSGPDIDQMQGLTSKRRSLYLRSAAEKEVEFLKIFDGPSVNECYQRHQTVMPQQSLALANSELTLAQAKQLAQRLGDGDIGAFVRDAFQRVLARAPTAEESETCRQFLTSHPTPARSRESLILVLFNHHDFVTIR